MNLRSVSSSTPLLIIILAAALGEARSGTAAGSVVGMAQETKEVANAVGFDVDEPAFDALREIYAQQSKKCKEATEITPKHRASRIEAYFLAKMGNKKAIGSNDLGDFSCDYLTRDVKLRSARLEIKEPVSLRSANIDGVMIDYPGISEMQRGQTILVPIGAGSTENVTLTGMTRAGKKVTWTGPSLSDVVSFSTGGTSAGCEIYVNSEPSKATVYFDDREWYQKTKTSSVRDPGKLKVRIKLEGYNDWEQQRDLEAGESWTIEAQLKRR